MITYDIICNNSHKFEGWFKSREDFKDQKETGLLLCPICGSAALEQMSAPAVKTSKNSRAPAQPSPAEVAGRLLEYINSNFEDVGNMFAEEAKKIHFKESKPRNIRGTATKEEVNSLKEDGIEYLPLLVPKFDS